MKTSAQYNQQSKSEVEETCIYQNMESGRRSSIYIQVYLKINKNSGFHARKNPKQQYLKVVTFSDASLSKERICVYDHAAQKDTEQTIQFMRKF